VADPKVNLVAALVTVAVAAAPVVPEPTPAPPAGPLVARPGGGFDWTDAALGAVAGVGVGFAVTGGLTLARGSRRRPDDEQGG